MTRDLPLAHQGEPGTATRGPARLVRGTLRRGALLGFAAVLGLSLVTSTAHADDLTDRRDRIAQQQAAKSDDLHESSAALKRAVAAYEAAQRELASAEATLAQTRRDLEAATRYDAQMQQKLDKAEKALAAAQVAVAKNQLELDQTTAVVGQVVRSQYQQRTDLLPMAMLLQTRSQADLQERAQWSTTMFDTTQATMDDLEEKKFNLELARKKMAAIEAQVAADRAEAARNLKAKAALEQQATQQQAAVAALVQRTSSAKASAAGEVAKDKKEYAALSAERSSVEQRIRDRIAAQRAAAKAKAERDRRAREAAAAKQRAREKASHGKKASSGGKKASSGSSSSSSRKRSRSSSSSASHGFDYPVSAPITSPYGMRFHPVLHYWKLHDGTDFGAGCGTAIRAPYSGRVVEKYFNAGYGNRLLIDHGQVDGSYITTAYNHAIRYTVGVGEHVSKGEVIGYVGTTGYSTGCHLHLMVWKNGSMINPMTWF